jgi:hypothetical protein
MPAFASKDELESLMKVYIRLYTEVESTFYQDPFLARLMKDLQARIDSYPYWRQNNENGN